MTARVRLILFAGALLAAGGAGALAGGLAPQSGGTQGTGGHSHGADAAHAGEGEPTTGLAVSDGGLTLRVHTARLTAGRTSPLRFSVLGAGGAPVSDMEIAHERPMHVIVVRRDLTGFQHVHPTVDRTGRWSVPLRLARPGVHRIFADFRHAGTAYTLSADLSADGAMTTRPLPPAGTVAQGDGRIVARVVARDDAPERVRLRYRVSADGAPLTSMRPHLGAAAHVVLLREGDLAFTHAHAERVAGAPGEIEVTIEPARPGLHRVFLQLRDAGAVRTLEHTLEVSR